jgi:hypothetical protein
MDLMDITNDLFKRKRKLNDFLDNSSDVKLTNSDAGTIQIHQNGTPSEVKLMIYHECLGIELVSPLCYSNGATYDIPPNQRIDFDSVMQTKFNIDLSRNEFICALMYKLMGKNTNKHHKTTYTHLVTVWKIDKFKRFHLVLHLIEHDKDQVWDRDRLKRLAEHCKLFSTQHDPIKERWLLHNGTRLMTSVNASCEEKYYKLEMTLSSTTTTDTQRPWYIDMDR